MKTREEIKSSTLGLPHVYNTCRKCDTSIAQWHSKWILRSKGKGFNLCAACTRDAFYKLDRMELTLH